MYPPNRYSGARFQIRLLHASYKMTYKGGAVGVGRARQSGRVRSDSCEGGGGVILNVASWVPTMCRFTVLTSVTHSIGHGHVCGELCLAC